MSDSEGESDDAEADSPQFELVQLVLVPPPPPRLQGRPPSSSSNSSGSGSGPLSAGARQGLLKLLRMCGFEDVVTEGQDEEGAGKQAAAARLTTFLPEAAEVRQGLPGVLLMQGLSQLLGTGAEVRHGMFGSLLDECPDCLVSPLLQLAGVNTEASYPATLLQCVPSTVSPVLLPLMPLPPPLLLFAAQAVRQAESGGAQHETKVANMRAAFRLAAGVRLQPWLAQLRQHWQPNRLPNKVSQKH